MLIVCICAYMISSNFYITIDIIKLLQSFHEAQLLNVNIRFWIEKSASVLSRVSMFYTCYWAAVSQAQWLYVCGCLIYMDVWNTDTNNNVWYYTAMFLCIIELYCIALLCLHCTAMWCDAVHNRTAQCNATSNNVLYFIATDSNRV